jgi:hypothetical protein
LDGHTGWKISVAAREASAQSRGDRSSLGDEGLPRPEA